MSWAKFDDRYHQNRKVRAAWRASRAAVGLHAMAITYCAGHETDGLVDHLWIEERLPAAKEREVVLRALTDAGLFHDQGNGSYLVNDYLSFNPSRAELDERRRKDSERKQRGRDHRQSPESERSPNGIHAESSRNPLYASARPDPARPDPESGT